jgi:hypothetical protein
MVSDILLCSWYTFYYIDFPFLPHYGDGGNLQPFHHQQVWWPYTLQGIFMYSCSLLPTRYGRMESEWPAHLFRTMVQQGEWTPTTVYGWQVYGIRCMLSRSSYPLPLAVMALTSYKPTTSIFIASNLSQVFISLMFHVTCLANPICML